jgi:hypothetical protein
MYDAAVRLGRELNIDLRDVPFKIKIKSVAYSS